MERSKVFYNSTVGLLTGKTPNGKKVTVGHSEQGAKGYFLDWTGGRFEDFGKQELKEIFGIAPYLKRSGGQEGHPSEPVIRALWRHFADRYNSGDPGVELRPLSKI